MPAACTILGPAPGLELVLDDLASSASVVGVGSGLSQPHATTAAIPRLPRAARPSTSWSCRRRWMRPKVASPPRRRTTAGPACLGTLPQRWCRVFDSALRGAQTRARRGTRRAVHARGGDLDGDREAAELLGRGWATFAGIVMIMLGVFHAIAGSRRSWIRTRTPSLVTTCSSSRATPGAGSTWSGGSSCSSPGSASSAARCGPDDRRDHRARQRDRELRLPAVRPGLVDRDDLDQHRVIWALTVHGRDVTAT